MDHHGRHRQRLAVAATVVLVLLLGGTWAGTQLDDRLRTAREDDARRVLPAVARGDCAAAAAAYLGATTGRMLPGRRRPPVAGDVTRAAADCRDLSRVDALAASGRPAEALRGYLVFRRDHVFSPLYGRARDRIGTVLPTVRPAPDSETCRLVAAERDPRNPPAPADLMPGLLGTCGQILAKTGVRGYGDRTLALDLLRIVRHRYGDSPVAHRAETAEAALLVATAGNRNVVSTPERVRASGSVKVTYWNHSEQDMTIALTGPGVGRVVEIPACAACPRLGNYDGCDQGKGHKAVVSLPPGTYRAWIGFDYGLASTDWHGTWRLRGGNYEDCFIS